ncbi:hypothetical protein [Aureliella helgolandensis]|uniref:Uncharacterized protein n=1 Tax=Aureliella helgolandensis TaxID=2527968 RepID=A0A518G571_9BACT|nr:hypothetical protein [Aureliella helgolandensis]QDV23741.1 hypothetical protein Q31a_20460 [Aureliella helgolandensis]
MTQKKKSNPKKTSAPVLSAPTAQGDLSQTEMKVLKIFREYLMTPGQMLCLGNADIDSMKAALEKMTAEGLLIPDSFKGSYSLTKAGFQAMNEAK